MHREMVISLLSAETRRRGKSLVPRANSLCSTAQAGSACLPVCPIARSNRVTPPEGGFSQRESRFLAQRSGRSSPSPFFPRTWTKSDITVWKCPRKSPEGCARKNGMQITSRCLCFCHQPLRMTVCLQLTQLFLAGQTNEIMELATSKQTGQIRPRRALVGNRAHPIDFWGPQAEEGVFFERLVKPPFRKH